MADETRRWYADSSVAYALAVLTLFETARGQRVNYVFGPLDTKSLTAGGLTVSGPAQDLDEVSAALSVIPGLVEERPD